MDPPKNLYIHVKALWSEVPKDGGEKSDAFCPRLHPFRAGSGCGGAHSLG